MRKYTVGYCWECCKDTKHRVIECEDNIGTKIFESIFTLGMINILERDYTCECTRCGEINTISF